MVKLLLVLSVIVLSACETRVPEVETTADSAVVVDSTQALDTVTVQ